MDLNKDERKGVVDDLIQLLQMEADRFSLKQTLKQYHPADIAEALEDLPDETKQTIMDLLDVEQTIGVLEEVSIQELDGFIEEAPIATLAEILEAMPADEAADMLEHADEQKAEQVIRQLSPDHAENVRELRGYEPETAGGIMTTEFFWAKPDDTAKQVLARLREEYEEAETVYSIFICRENMKLCGSLKVEDLITAPEQATMQSLMDDTMITIGPFADQELCVRYMQKYDLSILPVIDLGRRILGIITIDDILEIIEDEMSEDMYRLAGIGDPSPLTQTPLVRAYKRLPWLTTTLVGMGVVEPLILGYFFKGTLEKVVALAFFSPAIMGIGGNCGIQSSTVTVRGLATGEIVSRDLWYLLRREIVVALIVAVACSLALALCTCGLSWMGFSTVMFGHIILDSNFILRFATTVGLAMFMGILGSVMLGTCTPMFCHRIGIDPAIAAGPFVTTMIDIVTQTIYLTLGTYMLVSYV